MTYRSVKDTDNVSRHVFSTESTHINPRGHLLEVISTISCHSNFDRREVHTRSFVRFKMSEKQRKCSVCLGDMLPWDNHQACLKCRNDKKGKDKCVVSKESDCSICAGALKIPHKRKASKSKSSEKFDDSLLDEPTPSKSSQPSTSKPDSSLQDMIKAMNNQLASLASQFEEFKRSDKASASKNSLPLCQEQGMSAPVSQTRTQPSEGELSDEDSSLPASKRHRSKSPQGDADSHSQELDPSYVEMLNAIRGLLDLEVPQVECLVAPSAFSKKPSKQVVRKQNLALPPVQDIQSMWDYRFRKASGTSVKDKSSSESLSQGQFLAFERPDMICYTTSPQNTPLKAPKLPDSYFNIARVKSLSNSISVPSKQHIVQETVCRENVPNFGPCSVVLKWL